MSNKQFDILRASFFLVAFVIGAHVFITLLGMGTCLYFSDEIVAGKAKCDPEGRLGEVLSAALAAALAFAGGHNIRHSEKPKKPDYDENDPDGV